MGTPAYMPPEQAGGEVRKLDARSDVFGLGAILCQVLTGLPPYQGRDNNEVRLRAVRGEMAEALARLDGCGVEPDLVALCKRCLAFRQEDRPADGEAVAQEVARIRQAAEERARRAERERAEALVREAEQRKRRQMWLALAASLLVGLLASVGLGLWANYARQQTESARQAEAAANEQAQKRLKQVEKGNDILLSIFAELDIRKIKEGTEPLEAVLAKKLVKAAEQLEGEAVGGSLVVAGLQDRLGRTLLTLGYAKEAVPLLEKARNTRSTKLAADHPDTPSSMNNLAVGYHDAGQLDKALPLFEETLRLQKARLGADHPHTLNSMWNLAIAYCEAKLGEKAVPLFAEYFQRQRKRIKPNDPAFAGELAFASLKLLACERHKEAEPYLRECLTIREKTQPSAWTIFNTRSQLGGVLLHQKKYAEAEPLLLKGYEGMKQREQAIPPQGKPRLTEALERLVKLYAAWGKPDEAAKWRQELARRKGSEAKSAK